MADSSAIPRERFRADIEGLRAVAAILVAVYHIWLARVSGGVDVFFVIAGFLVTGTLLRQLEQTGRIRPGRYLGRLLVRLLPNALTVLVAVGIATVLLLPVTRQAAVFREIVASALYVENWQLIAQSVDYLDRDRADSPVQHFWAMSIQGQFYLLWLFLALCAIAVGARWAARRRLTVLVVTITVISFVCSVVMTRADQPVAYFHTATRAWEFGMGALVALGVIAVPRLADGRQRVLGWLGLLMIASTGAVLPVASVFPGVAALLPVGGAILILLCGTRLRGSAAALLATRPLVSLGGVAYAIYLWHWPLLVFSLHVRGVDRAGLGGGLLVLLASILLAYASTKGIEAPLRRLDWHRLGEWGAPLVGAASTAVLVAGVAMVSASASPTMPASQDVHLSHWARPGSAPDFTMAPSDDPYPGVLAAAEDKPPPIADGCHQKLRGEGVIRCSYGDTDAERMMILVGGSHSLHWQPALEEIAQHTGWRLDLVTKSGCRQGMSLVGPEFALYPAEDTEANSTCLDWDAAMLELILEEQPELVVASTTVVDEGAGDELPLYYERFWRELAEHDIPMLGIRATPRAFENRVDCIAEHGADAQECNLARSASFADVNPASALAEELPPLTVVDLSDWLCDETHCPAVIEDTIVYHDRHHLSGTFSRSLAQPLFREAAHLFE